MCEIVHIQAAGSNVGGHQQGNYSVAEFAHHYIALLLAEVAVEGFGVVAVGNQLVGDFLGVAACAAEDYSVNARVVVGYSFERKVFVACIHHIVDMAYVFGALVFGSDNYFFRFMHEGGSNACDFFGHGGREHEHFALFRNVCQDVVYGIYETHVEHFVGFVEHYGVYRFEFYHATVDQVDEAPGGGHYYLHAFAQSADLALDTRAAVDGQYFKFGHVFGEVGEVAGNLQAEFAGRSQHKSLRTMVGGIYELNQRQAEGRCFAGAGLGEPHQVVVAVEQAWNNFFLHGHGVFESQFGDSAKQVVADS